MRHVFTMQGRLSRRQYFINSMMIVALTYSLIFAFSISFARGVSGPSLEAAGAVGFLFIMMGLAAQGFLAVRRLHDLGKPGTHCWLLVVPLYNVYLGLKLLLARGVAGENPYGPDPLRA